MLRLTLAQMRLSLGLLTAAGLAIVISTAFVAASLIAGAVITRTSYDAVSASYAHADVVVSAPDGADGVDGGLTPADLAALRQVRGVAAVDGQVPLGTELVAGPKRVYPTVTAVASDPRLEVQTLVSGALPAGPHEVALPGPLADRLDVRVGDEVTTTRQTWAPEQAATAKPTADPATEPAGTWVASTERLTVVGLLDDPAGAFAQSGGAIVVPAADAARWAAQDASGGSGNPGAPATYPRAIVALAQGADAADVAAATSALRKAAPHGTTVRTKDDEAKATTAELTGGSDVFVPIVLGFASIALLVAALVISNTFGVLIAQRTRTLALLRCVGAGKRQLLRSVLIEAGLLGVASSALGLAVGVGLAQLALVVAGHLNLDVPLPAVVAITPAVVLAPLAVGTLVTLIAALAPARAATRVAPLAALRPAEVPAVTSRRTLN
jgi:putative ABC transport system permease protein